MSHIGEGNVGKRTAVYEMRDPENPRGKGATDLEWGQMVPRRGENLAQIPRGKKPSLNTSALHGGGLRKNPIYYGPINKKTTHSFDDKDATNIGDQWLRCEILSHYLHEGKHSDKERPHPNLEGEQEGGKKRADHKSVNNSLETTREKRALITP